jgi:hypothetical protein
MGMAWLQPRKPLNSSFVVPFGRFSRLKRNGRGDAHLSVCPGLGHLQEPEEKMSKKEDRIRTFFFHKRFSSLLYGGMTYVENLSLFNMTRVNTTYLRSLCPRFPEVCPRPIPTKPGGRIPFGECDNIQLRR